MVIATRRAVQLKKWIDMHALSDSRYTPTFFQNIEPSARLSAEVIVPIVQRLLNPRRVIDVGCGLGAWLAEFIRLGITEVLGVDGAWVKAANLQIPEQQFHCAELARAWHIPGRYDLAVCLEVGEHLPASVAPLLVERLTGLAPAVLFSAAIPGQGGINHVNEQWPGYWKALFEARGFVRLDPIRKIVWQDPKVAWFYKQNIYLFVDAMLLAQSPLLAAEHEWSRDNRLTLVLTHEVERMTSLWGALSLVRRTLTAAVRRRCRIFRRRAD
jgi:SAM-dependent methyltransferase